MKIPLNVTATATVDSAGVARCELGPKVYGETWHVTRMVASTNASADVDVSICKVYQNAETDSRFFSGTNAGKGDFDSTEFDMMTLDKLIFVWSGGVIGSVAIAMVIGIAETGRD